MTHGRSILFSGLALVAMLVAVSAGAQDLRPIAAPVCEAPISTCSFGPIEIAGDAGRAPAILADSCPAGYACTCVPSGPNLDDCDAKVCVRDGGRDLMCEERRRKAQTAVLKVVERFDYCRVASDCTWINDGTRCGGSCGALVNKKRARRAAKLIDRIDAKVCDDFAIGGCPIAIPACVEQVPVCIENRCVGLYQPPPPRPLPLPLPIEPWPGELLELEPVR